MANMPNKVVYKMFSYKYIFFLISKCFSYNIVESIYKLGTGTLK